MLICYNSLGDKMRLRNVKGAKEKIELSSYIIKDYKSYKGKFNKLFNNNHPIWIEIGMGKGSFIINMAKLNPQINFIGIEKFDSVMVRAVEKLSLEKIDNLKLIKMDADKINDVFEKEIDRIYLNFSDPWPKDRHHKRRLTDSNFLIKYDDLFKSSKNIIFKTDNRKLFEFSLKSFTDYGYKINNLSLNLHDDDIPNVETEYEIKFSNKGYPIYMVDVIKHLDS